MKRSLRVGASAVAAVAVAAYLGAAVWLKVNEDDLVYLTAVSRHNVQSLDMSLFAQSTLRTPDGLRLQTVELVPPAGRKDPFWILFLHGNGASIQTPDVQDQLRKLHVLGYGAFALD